MLTLYAAAISDATGRMLHLAPAHACDIIHQGIQASGPAEPIRIEYGYLESSVDAQFFEGQAILFAGVYEGGVMARGPIRAFMRRSIPTTSRILARQRADILVRHEALSCHLYGFEAIDELARAMRVVRSFQGHQHDDRSPEYALVRERLGFDARAVAYCAIKNGLGEVILGGPTGW